MDTLRDHYLSQIAALYPLPRALAFLYLSLLAYAMIRGGEVAAIEFLWSVPVGMVFSLEEGVLGTVTPLMILLLLALVGASSSLYYYVNRATYDSVGKIILSRHGNINDYVKDELYRAKEFWSRIEGDRASYLVSIEASLEARMQRFGRMTGWSELAFIMALAHVLLILAGQPPAPNLIFTLTALCLTGALFMRALLFYVGSVVPLLIAVRAAKGQSVRFGEDEVVS